MIKEIEAKVLLSHVRQPDDWFGLRYNMNLYRGCQHQCIYCDSRSLCYGIENFEDVLVKVNAIPLLRQELASKRIRDTIGTGSMSDPYTPVEKQYNLTGQALQVIAEFGFPVHIITKSDLVLKDLAALQTINRVHAVVSFSLTTVDDKLAKKLEPGAPPPSARLRAMETLAEAGIHTGVVLMPVLPFLADDAATLAAALAAARDHGASYVLPSFGMTLRDRQRVYYYGKLDKLFGGLRRKYQRTYGSQYHCAPPHADRLRRQFYSLCDQFGLRAKVTRYEPASGPQQLPLF